MASVRHPKIRGQGVWCLGRKFDVGADGHVDNLTDDQAAELKRRGFLEGLSAEERKADLERQAKPSTPRSSQQSAMEQHVVEAKAAQDRETAAAVGQRKREDDGKVGQPPAEPAEPKPPIRRSRARRAKAEADKPKPSRRSRKPKAAAASED